MREMLVLAEKKNFSEAAEELFISQSSLSRHIATMESKLQVKLFERNSRFVRLTEAGEVLLPFAKEITRMEEYYKEELKNLIKKEKARLKVGLPTGEAFFGITEKLTEFFSKNQDVMFFVERHKQSDMKELLKEGKLDFIFVFEDNPPVDDGLQRITIGTDRIVVVLPNSHPLARKKGIDIEQLKNEKWLIPSESTVLYKRMMKLFRQGGYIPQPAWLNASGLNIMELVASGMGISMEQENAVKEKRNKNIVLVPLTEPECLWFNLIWDGRSNFPASKRFLSFMRKSIAAKSS